ncbi:PTS sugar transporter subunit IIA [Fonticella tunisiensis]|uniref:PTS system IIA component (Gat family) n=1 Tax=Fonticella tunisiensis TaxID=1096341 RepID=A0A4V3EVD0_9CLOT|nr:PTS sugar transporter subunit IIA [Fonticella tunisiensis]TDT63605.1 PTS system IIA component (Gat family) [Fonticella tunisiensis]
MKILDLVKKDLVVTKLEVESRGDLFKVLYEKLYSAGFVKESFLDGIENREAKFPTGLQLSKYGAAIPHTDPEHVIEPAVVVATLSQPVIFKSMENPTNDVKVNIVFMLAIKEPHMQLEMLKQMSRILQNDSLLEQMLQANEGDEIIEIIKTA